MELRRRETMNKYLEDFKSILLRYSPNNASKLEKNDILREALRLVSFLESKITQIQQQTILAIIAELRRNKGSDEVIKSVCDVTTLLFSIPALAPQPTLKYELPTLPQNFCPSTYSVLPVQCLFPKRNPSNDNHSMTSTPQNTIKSSSARQSNNGVFKTPYKSFQKSAALINAETSKQQIKRSYCISSLSPNDSGIAVSPPKKPNFSIEEILRS